MPLSANYLQLHAKQWKDTGKYSTLNDTGIWLNKIDKLLFSYYASVRIIIKTIMRHWLYIYVSVQVNTTLSQVIYKIYLPL